MIEVREKLRRARTAFKWSAARCDEAAGVKVGRTYSYERGRAVPPREFLKPLAKEWGIDLEWFYDGVDDFPPIGQNAKVAGFPELPIHGHLPSKGASAANRGTRAAKVSFALPNGAHYRQILSSDLEPFLRRGDWVLCAPSDVILADTLAVCEWSGFFDVADLTMSMGEPKPVPVTESQTLPEGDWKQVAVIVEVSRRLASGLLVAFENEAGLSKSMLRLP